MLRKLILFVSLAVCTMAAPITYAIGLGYQGRVITNTHPMVCSNNERKTFYVDSWNYLCTVVAHYRNCRNLRINGVLRCTCDLYIGGYTGMGCADQTLDDFAWP